MSVQNNILSSPIEYLKGVGPLRADWLKKELNIFTFNDLLHLFPYRHIDKSTITAINNIETNAEYIQVVGKLTNLQIIGERKGKRLTATLKDETGSIELVWFQGISWIQKILTEGSIYLVFGKLSYFNNTPQIIHAEIELYVPLQNNERKYFEPVYPSTEKLKAKGLNGRQIAKLTFALWQQITIESIPENIPENILTELNLLNRYKAYKSIHYPANKIEYNQALNRLKFEEFFIAQVRLNLVKIQRHQCSKGVIFEKVGALFNNFYSNHLPFELTNAQKNVLKQIRQDAAKGHQMNRLLQGDVGSGKTIVALLSMLLAADNGYQSCLMAPTEILAMQHYNSLNSLLQPMNISVSLLTGSTKAKERKAILTDLQEGKIKFIVGTHALIEENVQFNNLGFAVVDEQHRFGVAQRAALWKKSVIPPHILVMTATPIPRTLAMTAYGDLDYSIIDELPKGRQAITTVHRNEMQRMKVMEFIRDEVTKGRQAYIIYPLIEESEKLSYEDLMQGYQETKSYFPEPKYSISVLHGKMPIAQKETNMQRFVEGTTQIMVSTTVIEVGVNVPNATVMVIESAEKFGLSQLHQLRGRVGRGSEKSFCILLTGSKVSTEALERIHTMCTTSNGFIIAEKDLELRGPGDVDGVRQSGALNFKLASIVNDRELLEKAKQMAEKVLTDDVELKLANNLPLKNYLNQQKGKTNWSKIS
ncbi:MAG TPA: ATP-dependent DNA helicase RecG [Chitinophagaceae bacterium]|nr:ATP-dependent DNA helicase RecG [Chitinophagaceae bacterium]MCC6634106.1 ATP-dependent DNA helicase RecG [Chitinophagaceae bacterium]HNM34994.1 ATP-dependent DNA helicase RecG [Chitinophagaceae bacterium]HNN31933.1 ATP-dependent DNA helicase RecG [Chitinophagaceae bacterium]